MVNIIKNPERNRQIENFMKQQEANKPKPEPRDWNLYHMQQIVNKAKNGEKL